MKVILSIDPIKFPLTGIGRYTYELAQALAGHSGISSLRFFRGGRFVSGLPDPVDSEPTLAFDMRSRLLKSRMAVGLYSLVAPRWKGMVLRNHRDWIYHGPNFYLPPFAGRSVATIHDLSVFVWPQCHPPERVRYMQAEIELSLQRATVLITDTEYTRQEVAKFFGWPLERIHAVPLGSAAEFRPRGEEELKKALRVFGLTPQGYTLFTGTVEPRKNIGVLLDAYARLPVAVRTRWPLVIAGYRGWGSDDLHARMDSARGEGWLRYLGFVPHDVLPLLTAGARLFAYPSLYEGFGLPVLEAMACCVPVVCSNASTLPEVAGSAAAFHAPEDDDALLALLQAGLEDDAWRASAGKAGLAQAAKFSWERCTRQTLDVYKTVLTA